MTLFKICAVKWVGVLAVLLLLAETVFGNDNIAGRPNIVVMMADDMGITDAACYGGRVKTARLDRLAQEGIRFTNFYSGAPNCSPSRTAQLTGRTPSRVGVYDYLAADSPMRLPETEITTPEILKKAGYSTAHFGKWHLSTYDSKNNMLEGTPDKHGYDYWFGCANNAMPTHLNPNNYHRNGTRLDPLEGYSCQNVATEAIRWLQSNWDKQTPFFMTVWYNEPHVKLAAPDELVEKYKALGYERDREALYYATIENLDIATGRLLDALDSIGLRQNTLVIFTSDNGPELFKTSSDPYREKKSFVFDGGIRVPGIVRWPGHAEGGKTSDVPIGFVDFMPTFAAIAGGEPPTDRTLDGENMLPAFEGKQFKRTKPLYWFFYKKEPMCALRDGDWKITAYTENFSGTPSWHFDQVDQAFIKNAKMDRFELFSMKEDPCEKTDVSADHPEVFSRMKRMIVKIHEEMVHESPTWEGLPAQ